MSAMCPERPACHAAQRGFAIVSAIFLLVVLGALGAFMVTLSTVQNVTSTQDLQGVRAYQAARAGIEWGAYQVLTPENTNPPAGQAQYVCPGSGTTLAGLGGALTGFSVTVLCDTKTYTEGANLIGIYQLTSTATFGTAGSSNYVERQLTATLSTCRTAVNGPSC